MKPKPSRPYAPLDSKEEKRDLVGCLLSFVCGIAAVACIIARLVYLNLP